MSASREPDIVHTHLAKAGFLGRTAASRRNVKAIVHTFHGHVLEGYFSKPVSRVVELERQLAKRTDVLIAVSLEIRDELLALGIGRASQWQVMPVGVDLAPFLDAGQDQQKARASLGLPVGGPLVGIVGRLVPSKRITPMHSLGRPPGWGFAPRGDVRHCGRRRARIGTGREGCLRTPRARQLPRVGRGPPELVRGARCRRPYLPQRGDAGVAYRSRSGRSPSRRDARWGRRRCRSGWGDRSPGGGERPGRNRGGGRRAPRRCRTAQGDGGEGSRLRGAEVLPPKRFATTWPTFMTTCSRPEPCVARLSPLRPTRILAAP